MKENKFKSLVAAVFIFFIIDCSLGCVQSNNSVKKPPAPPPSNYEPYNPPLKLYVINDVVNIRSGPGKENGVIGSGKKGQLVTVSGKMYDWYIYKPVDMPHK